MFKNASTFREAAGQAEKRLPQSNSAGPFFVAPSGDPFFVRRGSKVAALQVHREAHLAIATQPLARSTG